MEDRALTKLAALERKLERRFLALEEHSHEPFDFTHLVRRLEEAEARCADLQRQIDGLRSGSLAKRTR